MSARAVFFAAALLVAGPVLAQTPDPLASLARSVTLATADSLTLVEDDHGVSSTRTLKVGEVYKDGWTLTALSGNTATLTKGRQVRAVTLGASGGPAQEQAVAAAGAAPKVNLSNAVAGERIKQPAQAADRARIQAAITAGDPRTVFSLGGSATDVAQALAANGGPMSRVLASADSVDYVNVGGRAGISVQSGDESNRRTAMVVPPELAGVEPPADARVVTPPALPPGANVAADGQGNVMIRQRIEQ